MDTFGNRPTYQMALAVARQSFDEAVKKLDQVKAERAFLEEEIVRLRRTITALSAMCSESPALDNLGITDSVAMVMDAATTLMTTKDVVQALDQLGFDLASQKSAMASVHAVLNRMATAKKIERTTFGSDVAWKGPNYDPDEIPF